MTRMKCDGFLLLAGRGLRMLAFGWLSVILGLYLAGQGLSEAQIGLLFAVALAGGTAATAAVSLVADGWGRRRTLLVASLWLAASGIALATSRHFDLLLSVAALGTLSPTGHEVGPFHAVEQAALAQLGRTSSQVRLYAWYNLIGTLAGAVGALVAGTIPPSLERAGWSPLQAQKALVWAFAGSGIILAAMTVLLSAAVEASPQGPAAGRRGGLHESRSIVLRLCGLFAVDSLAGGLVVQSLVALWFHQRFGLGLERLGPLFFGTNVLSALSFLAAARLADRFGLLSTMVFTHLPSNVLLALVPFYDLGLWAMFHRVPVRGERTAATS